MLAKKSLRFFILEIENGEEGGIIIVSTCLEKNTIFFIFLGKRDLWAKKHPHFADLETFFGSRLEVRGATLQLSPRDKIWDIFLQEFL